MVETEDAAFGKTGRMGTRNLGGWCLRAAWAEAKSQASWTGQEAGLGDKEGLPP